MKIYVSVSLVLSSMKPISTELDNQYDEISYTLLVAPYGSYPNVISYII